jgi:rhamnogalacturonyl hydrolase YesR
MVKQITESFQKLKNYCEAEAFKGFDPYDGLNSSIFQAIPILPKLKYTRLAWIQFFKRCPINFRNIAGVKKEYNPKALGLFLSSYCRLYKVDPKEEYLEKINFFIEKINNSITPGYSGACWGYNFDWEALAFFQPKHTPTVVASSFIAQSLLDAYEITGNKSCLETARSTCNFILKDLNRTYETDGNFAFSYSPKDKSTVFNATLLGSRLLARVYYHTKESLLKEEAEKSIAFCCNHQNKNGSWAYSKYSFHQWIDGFHTGYNLECINDYIVYTNDTKFESNLVNGFKYYIETFFTDKGVPKYYNNKIYPIDVHSTAQMIVTVFKLNKYNEYSEIVDKVVKWTIDNMQSKSGYFYYQKNKYYTNKIPYMRWCQAWMFYAFSIYCTSPEIISKNN